MVWWRWKDGSFGCILFGWWLHIKAPWAFAYFSERYGYTKWRHVGFGWRFRARRMEPPDDVPGP